MDLSTQKEQFSNAYFRAVVAAAGYGIYKPEPDEDSVDWGVAARGGGGMYHSPRLEVQLKASTAELSDPRSLRHRLKMKNYNDLKVDKLWVPRILLVVRVPEDPVAWLRQDEAELALRHCGYWLSLRGQPDVPNEDNVTVQVPRTQIFSVSALQQLMQRIANGAVP
jgi:Domain of unknown function (DUF4365)